MAKTKAVIEVSSFLVLVSAGVEGKISGSTGAEDEGVMKDWRVSWACGEKATGDGDTVCCGKGEGEGLWLDELKVGCVCDTLSSEGLVEVVR